ncbi:helix-turn-helix domain-containing protein [Microbispora sp. H11081]|uniref:ATP-binding protein n=1 Tax=Microbispora sp. H11081 TaxID=2729107 RepID=UPI00147270E0|nr:helix-turn-helix domain-containing protein [Microbispora sp. H11081]
MGDAFGALLRSHRLRLRLTQEALAERAGISSRSIAELERGRGRGPRPRSLEQLATALDLDGQERERFFAAGDALFWASRAGRPHRTPPVEDAPAAAPTWRQLPPDLPDFVGRDEELALLAAVLDPLNDNARLAVLSGPPGVGKTALAVHAGHRFSSWFPDGHLYAALRGATADPADIAEVLAQWLRALGVHGSALPAGADARAALLRDRLAARQVLLVADDAGGYRQVEQLLPAKGVAVVVTSRLPLTGLPGVTSVDLRPLPGPTAVRLLSRVAGEDRVRAEPAAANELVSACGGLPLAVRIAGARLAARPHWTVESFNERLADERRRLDELRHGDLAVRPGLGLALRGLTPAAARAFALLGELGVPSFPEWCVAALLGADPAVGATVLEELLDARLVEAVSPDQAGQPRYRFHDITRIYARERREAEIDQAEWTAALARVAAGWLALARQAHDRLDCLRLHLDDRDHAADVTDQRARAVAAERPVEWFEAEREALAVLVPACAEAGLTATARCLAGCGADFYELRGYYDDWQRAVSVARAACRQAGDRPGEATMLRGLGSCLIELDDPDAALAALRQAQALAEEIGDPACAALAGKEIGFTLGITGRLQEAEAELRTAVEGLGQADLPLAMAIALTSLGFVLRERGETAAAVEVVDSALTVARSCGARFTEAYALRGLAGALRACHRIEEAERAARAAATLFEQVGDLIGAAQSLRVLGETLAHEPHRVDEAEQALAAAAALFRDQGHRWGLALTELSLGEIEARHGDPRAAERLRRSLRYWTDEQVPALQARTLVALATTAEQRDDPAARELLGRAYELYRALEAPAAAQLATRLGIFEGTASPA